MAINVDMVSHKADVLSAMQADVKRALEMCGLLAEGYAQVNLTNSKAVDTGRLRNSINHKVVIDDAESAVYIGTNVEYAPYIEFGTGIYYEGGRRTSWVYKDRNGDFHMTRGMRARPYLKPAVADHEAEYRQILEDELKK